MKTIKRLYHYLAWFLGPKYVTDACDDGQDNITGSCCRVSPGSIKVSPVKGRINYETGEIDFGPADPNF